MKQETSVLRKRITTAAVIAVGGTALFAGLKPGGNTNRGNHNNVHLNMDTNTTPAGVPGEPRGSGGSPSYSRPEAGAAPSGIEQVQTEDDPDLTGLPIPDLGDHNHTPAGVPGENRG